MTEAQQQTLNQVVNELLVFLEDRVASVGRMLDQLNQLRAAVIRRDEEQLRRMQDCLPLISAERSEMDIRQRQLCETFAGIAECRPEEVNLTRVGLFLDRERKAILVQRQQTLREMMSRLSMEHHATEQLLRECERLNRAILDGIIGKRNQTLTYTPYGQTCREIHHPIVSMRV
ncbi:MAG: hypothetical protein ABFD91_00585 [Anaerohalosphaeraceae bacterium]